MNTHINSRINKSLSHYVIDTEECTLILIQDGKECTAPERERFTKVLTRKAKWCISCLQRGLPV